ncbi:MAG: ATP-binding protein [Defluviitaleaceae bacterium]|nr:ATP-binding protein [Defluviitaleaceae bacterium]
MIINEISEGLTFEEFFNGIPAACILFNSQGEPLASNHAVLGLVGANSRARALTFFFDNELRRNILDYKTEFTYSFIQPDSGEQIQLAMYMRPFRSGYIMAYADRCTIEEARGQLMLDSAPMAVNFFDKNSEVVDCNMEAVRMFGFKEKSDYIEHFMRLMPPIQPNGRSSKKLILEFIKEAFENGYSKHEFVRQKIDGSLMQTEASFVRTDHRGEPVVMGYSRDLTDVYAAMEREREAREMAQIYMDNSPIGMEIWDEQMQIVDCNRQVVEMFGFVDKNAFLARVKDDWDGEHITPLFLQQALEAGFARYEWDFDRVDGSSLPCEVRLVRVLRDNMPQVIAYFIDLSEVRKAADAASEAEKRSKIMLDATPLACFLIREDVTALDCNLAAVELFGFENKADAIMNYRDIFPKYSPEGNPLTVPTSLEWVNTSELMKFEYSHISISTGEYIPCEVTMIYTEHQSQPIMACYMRDLRETKAMMAEMHRREVAEEESRAKSQFLARMSHEIRTPLNAIVGVSDIQLLKGGHAPEIEDAFVQIQSSSNVLLRIINDILDLSKVEAGKMEIFDKPYEVASMIYDTVQLNLMHLASKNINFNLRVNSAMPNILIGDELRIKQVLNNILSNAFKYTREGEVNLRFDIEHEKAQDNDAYLLIELQDSGQGMTEDQLASLFENEYIRFNESNNRLIEGTGLGMNITNRMISMMNGRISAKSELGVGSTFYVRLPQKIGSDSILGEEITENLQSFQLSRRSFKKRFNFEYEHMPYGSVLVVDDVESNLFVAKGLLIPYGLNIETALSGVEAIKKIREGKTYDIIFMDHMMPDLDGIETAKELRSMGYNEPIIALTANTIIGQAELFMSNGFAGFISKPIDVSRMNTYLIQLIRDKQSEDVIEEAKKSSPHSYDLSGAVTSSFVRDALRALEILDELLKNREWNEDDYKLYTINTHGMKSALANVGRALLSDTAGNLEQSGREKDDKEIRKNTPQFIEDLRDVVKSLSPQEEISVGPSAENRRLLFTSLTKIQKACESYNKKAARAALEELNKHSWTKETNELLSNIAANLLHSAFEEICEEVASFMKS